MVFSKARAKAQKITSIDTIDIQTIFTISFEYLNNRPIFAVFKRIQKIKLTNGKS